MASHGPAGPAFLGDVARRVPVAHPLLVISSSMWHLGLRPASDGSTRVNTHSHCSGNVSVIDTLMIPFASVIWLSLESVYRRARPHQTNASKSRTEVAATESACGLAIRRPHYPMGWRCGRCLSAPPGVSPAPRGRGRTFRLWTRGGGASCKRTAQDGLLRCCPVNLSHEWLDWKNLSTPWDISGLSPPTWC